MWLQCDMTARLLGMDDRRLDRSPGFYQSQHSVDGRFGSFAVQSQLTLFAPHSHQAVHTLLQVLVDGFRLSLQVVVRDTRPHSHFLLDKLLRGCRLLARSVFQGFNIRELENGDLLTNINGNDVDVVLNGFTDGLREANDAGIGISNNSNREILG